MANIHNLTSFCIFSKNFSHSLLKVKKRGRRDAPCSGPRPVLTPVLLSLPGVVGPVQLGPGSTRPRPNKGSHPTGKRPTGTEYSPLSADLSKTITNTNENTTTNTNTNTNDNTNTNTEPTLSPRQLCPSKYIKPYHIYMHLSSILIDSFTAKLLDFSKTSLFEINCDFENRFW